MGKVCCLSLVGADYIRSHPLARHRRHGEVLYLLRVPCTSHIQFKTCSEQYGGQLLVDVSKLCNDFPPHFKYLPLPGNAKPFRWAISEQTRPSTLGNDQEFRRWQNLGRNWKSSPWSYLLGAFRGIANPEIISSFGPGTLTT